MKGAWGSSGNPESILKTRVAVARPGPSTKIVMEIRGVLLLLALPPDWKFLATMGGAAAAALGMIAYAFFRPAEEPEQQERKRRLHLNQIGRIAEGQVVELVEHPPVPKETRKTLFGSGSHTLGNLAPRHLVSYSYSISGVTYQTAQDITGLEGQIRFGRLVAGQSASVKYDPSNPTDSIIVADDWSGLR
jgi:hypothetical protein